MNNNVGFKMPFERKEKKNLLCANDNAIASFNRLATTSTRSFPFPNFRKALKL